MRTFTLACLFCADLKTRLSAPRVQALLQDPKKMLQLLQHNPALASIVQQWLPPGFPLPKP